MESVCCMWQGFRRLESESMRLHVYWGSGMAKSGALPSWHGVIRLFYGTATRPRDLETGKRHRPSACVVTPTSNYAIGPALHIVNESKCLTCIIVATAGAFNKRGVAETRRETIMLRIPPILLQNETHLAHPWYPRDCDFRRISP